MGRFDRYGAKHGEPFKIGEDEVVIYCEMCDSAYFPTHYEAHFATECQRTQQFKREHPAQFPEDPKARKERVARLASRNMEQAYTQASKLVPRRFRTARLTDFDGYQRWRDGATSAFWRFADVARVEDDGTGRGVEDLAFDGDRGCILYGPRGNGKTRRACAVAIEVEAKRILRSIEDGKPNPKPAVRFLTARGLVDAEKATFNDRDQPRAPRPGSPPLVILDDLGAESTSSWNQSFLTDWLSEAYDKDAGLIITSNLDLGGIRTRYGARVASRLVEMCLLVPVAGDDRRLQKFRVEKES